MAQERFYINYGKFSDNLTIFVELLTERYKKGSPDALFNVNLIPTLLPKNEARTLKPQDFIHRFRAVQDITTDLLKYIGVFVVDEYREWLKKQIRDLMWRLDVVERCFASLTIDGDSYVDSPMSAGFGSINTGVRPAMSGNTLERLRDLKQVLQQG